MLFLASMRVKKLTSILNDRVILNDSCYNESLQVFWSHTHNTKKGKIASNVIQS